MIIIYPKTSKGPHIASTTELEGDNRMRCNAPLSRKLVMAAFALALSACNANSGSTGLPIPYQSLAQGQPQAPLNRKHHHGSSGKIKHVVIIVQENRSFNNLFYGFPGATTTNYGYDTTGQKIKLLPIGLADDLGHRTQLVRVLRGVQRDGQHSRHELPDERLQ